MNNLGLYVHVPFCLQKCRYCDFYSLAGKIEYAPEYARQICRQLSFFAEYCRDRICDSVYIGGGTPSVIDPRLIAMILETVHTEYRLSSDCEITLECNPATARAQAFALYASAGVNRVSVGVQTYRDDTLQKIGRTHTFKDALETLRLVFAAGIENVSCDLIYGLPYQEPNEPENAFYELMKRGISHLSLYGLKIEPDTPFGRMKDLVLPGEEEDAKTYLHLCGVFEKHGFHRYEISNFSHPGKESRHNLKYWTREEYLGLGPAAHSFFGGVRFFSDRDLRKFLLEKDFSLNSPYYSAAERITTSEAREEELMLSLRLTRGYPVCKILKNAADPKQCEEYVSDLQKGGFAEVTEDRRLVLTPRGALVSNTVISDLLAMYI